MAHRTILTERQRSALFDLPTDEAGMLRHYTLADEDIEIIRVRRGPHNRFGFALQLCALRYPGRLLAPGENIPLEVTRFLAAQLGLQPDDLIDYGAREETRRDHLITLPSGLSRNADAPRQSCPACLSSNGFALTPLSRPSAGLKAGSLTGWMRR